nr:uncharacterized protein LOC117687649 [Crassostrea gigas]
MKTLAIYFKVFFLGMILIFQHVEGNLADEPVQTQRMMFSLHQVEGILERDPDIAAARVHGMMYVETLSHVSPRPWFMPRPRQRPRPRPWFRARPRPRSRPDQDPGTAIVHIKQTSVIV